MKAKNSNLPKFVLQDDRFEKMPLALHGVYKSMTFPGLWLDSAALIRGDMATVANLPQAGIATAKHGLFVES